MLEIRFFNYICDDVPECHDKIIIRKRFAYLANENISIYTHNYADYQQYLQIVVY